MLIPNSIETEILHHPLWEKKGIELSIKRLDQVHSMASGNKFFKLKYNLIQAQKLGKSTLLTFGGAYSNHIFATAAAAEYVGFKSIGIIRGEETLPLNPTLKAAQSHGMELQYLSRSVYRNKKEEAFIDNLKKQYGDFYLVPEGGTNALAIQGTAEILTEKDSKFSHICTSIGTGGTFSGLAKSIEPDQVLIGFSSLKGDFIHEEIRSLFSQFEIQTKGKIQILDQYHFGGYGKHNEGLLEFIRWFYQEFQIPLDPVYTGKMVYGLLDQIKNNLIPIGSKILVLHTGGIQGIAGFNQRFGLSLPL
ncbi:1-aminocyclopropane-1-carboxylate deaminase/D-cysteine desulfhydrase [Cecembia rubra]|uniref:1-aminocyclopropane-1-carboxylate deaminase n=1 Tax=Cecembia rubra TaxID=1485585 RepID=A0A2P8E0P8_9BACT|nr:pyridoxal-phosphate dependent enzyme [Cecembia rubra]PSL03056.1 1-aminocyclopropane-1-carboxylate deaminase [Cecembia rubra]